VSAFSDRGYRESFARWSLLHRGREDSNESETFFLIESFRDSARFQLWRHVRGSMDLLAAEVPVEDEFRFLSPELLFGLRPADVARIDGACFDGDRIDRAYLLAVHGWLDGVMDVTDAVASFRDEVFTFVADWVLGELLFGDDPQRGIPVLALHLHLVPHAAAALCTPIDFVDAVEAGVPPEFLREAWAARVTHSDSIITAYRLGLSMGELLTAGGNDAFPAA